MKIVHELKRQNNYSYFLNCPMCGAEFKEFNNIKLIEDGKNKRLKLLENKKELILLDDFEIKENKVYTCNCSGCTFSVDYYFEEIKTERKINQTFEMVITVRKS